MIEDAASNSPNVDLTSLCEWRSTADFSRQVAKFDEEAGDDLLTDRRWKPLREALVLRDFAVTLGYADCKLCHEREQFPDAMVRSPGKELQIEITEVMTPGRQRDKEFREFKKNTEQKTLSHHEWEEVRKAGLNWPEWTAAAVKKKLKYGSSTQFDILVYNNISHVYEMPEIDQLSMMVGDLLAKAGYQNHWVWQYRSTTIDLLWPRVLRLKIPGWEERF